MSEIRQDPTTKEWVIIATERSKRPSGFANRAPKPATSGHSSSCPFCPGNENMTASPVLLYQGRSDSYPWSVRVFVNKFPAVTPDAVEFRRVDQNLFLKFDGSGHHEVIVESPVHNEVMAFMNERSVAEVLSAYRERYIALAQKPRVKSIVIFKNYGPSAGTSLEHPHSQLVATPMVPRHMRIQHEVAAAYFDDKGCCLYSDLRDRELEAGTRLIMETETFVVFHPFASHRPFETWIMSKANQASFSQIGDEDIQHLAHVLRTTLLKMYRGLDDPDFNMVVDSAPVGEELSNYYRWHIRIIPRISETAGFEIGSGIFINVALPEETAPFLRDVKA